MALQALIFVLASWLLPMVHSESAHVLLQKKYMADYIVEGQNVSVQYLLHNIGSLGASNIKVKHIGDENFELLGEEKEVVKFFEELEPDQNVSYNVSFLPKDATVAHDVPATFTYEFEVDGKVSKRNGFSSSSNEVKILSEGEHLRATSHYVKEWTTFFVLQSFPVLLPLFFWLNLEKQNSLGAKAKRF